MVKTRNNNATDNGRQWLSLLTMAVLAVVLLAAGAGTAGAAETINTCTEINATSAPPSGEVVLTDNITSPSADPCIHITTSNIVFNGGNNTISGSGNIGVRVNGTSVSPISNVTVKDVSTEGVNIGYTYVNGGDVIRVSSSNNTVGIQRSLTDRVNVTDSVFHDNVFGINGGSDARVTDNVVTGSTSAGINLLSNTDTNYVARNNISDNPGDGIVIDNDADLNQVVDNDILRNGGNGVYVSRGSITNLIRGNSIERNNGSGIKVLSGSDSNTISENSVLGNNRDGNSPFSDAGIFVNDSTQVVLTDNVVRNNERAGVSIAFADGINVIGNRITENCGGNFGVSLGETADATFVRNNVSNNTGVGMQVFETSPNLEVRDSKFNDNGGLGGLQDEPGATLVNVTANGNEGYGLSLSENTTLRDGEARNNMEHGIVANDGSTTLEDVVVSNNGQEEIDFDGPTPSSATNLTVGSVRYASIVAQSVLLEETASPQPTEPAGLERVTDSTDIVAGTYMDKYANATLSYTDGEVANVEESSITPYKTNGTEWSEISDSATDTGANEVNFNVTSFSTFALFGNVSSVARDGCIDRRSLGRGQESQECPTDRTIERGESRRDLDRDTDRRSATSRRDRGR